MRCDRCVVVVVVVVVVVHVMSMDLITYKLTDSDELTLTSIARLIEELFCCGGLMRFDAA
jgi:hypothetical protein